MIYVIGGFILFIVVGVLFSTFLGGGSESSINSRWVTPEIRSQSIKDMQKEANKENFDSVNNEKKK